VASSPPDRLERIAEQVARIKSENARLVERVAESERRFRRISLGVLRLQEEERSRISRDLHDGIGQLLTALKIQLELLEREAESLPAILARVESARELSETALAEVRELSHLLRPQMLDELGLESTLRWLARTFQRRTGIAVEREEFDGDFCCIAAPVLDARRRFVAAVGISMSRRAFDEERTALEETVRDVSRFQASADARAVLEPDSEPRLPTRYRREEVRL